MTIVRIPFDEFRDHLTEVLRRVSREHETVIVETGENDRVVVRPGGDDELIDISSPKTEADFERFLSSAGGWADVDTDRLLADIYGSRDTNNQS
jgi:hypothetical protein